MTDTKISVLIVGAGPVGLTLACELSRRGIDFRIIDKVLEPTDKSKAIGIQSRTLEIFECMGIVSKFLEKGQIVYGTTFWEHGNKLLHLSLDEIEGPYPYALMYPQCDTEKLLREQLSSLSAGKVEIERGRELKTFTQTASGVTSTIVKTDGSEETIQSLWIVGCDGAHSAVRHTLGLTFEGAEYPEGFATFDVHVKWDKPDDELNMFISGKGFLACFPLGNGRYRLIADEAVAKHKTGDVLTLEEAQTIVDERGSGNMLLSDPVWLTWFTIHRREANKYQKGRALIAGDAAHIHSPALGQGMNAGIQDAFNLAWKIALVVKGLADETLITSYDAERHPVGKELLKTTDLTTRLVTLRNPVSTAVRDKLLPLVMGQEVVQHRALKTLSMLGVNYRHSPIVGEHKDKLPALDGSKGGGVLTAFGAWLDFGHGPEPGDRAPDGYLINSQDSETMRLFPLLANTDHNLLIFAGLTATDKTFSAMNETAASVKKEFGALIRVHLVIAGTTKPDALDTGSEVLFDTDNSFHHVYGAASECLYLIRPDLYVGYRSQSLQVKYLLDYLQGILKPVNARKP